MLPFSIYSTWKFCGPEWNFLSQQTRGRPSGSCVGTANIEKVSTGAFDPGSKNHCPGVAWPAHKKKNCGAGWGQCALGQICFGENLNVGSGSAGSTPRPQSGGSGGLLSRFGVRIRQTRQIESYAGLKRFYQAIKKTPPILNRWRFVFIASFLFVF